MSQSRSAAVRLTATLALLLSLLAGPLLAAAPAAAQDAEPYDLAATILPFDAFELADSGEGFGVNATRFLPVERFAEEELLSTDEETIERLTDAGWLAAHTSEYWVAADVEATFAAYEYFVRVSQYSDESGAEEVFGLMRDALSGESASGPGDDAFLATLEFEPNDTTYQEGRFGYTLVFLSEDVIGSVRLLDVRSGDFPESDELESLAEQVLDRIEAMRDDETPGLSLLVQRLSPENASTGTDGYKRLDDENLPWPSRTIANHNAQIGEDAVDVYSLSQYEEIDYEVFLFAFESEDEAAALVENASDFVAESLAAQISGSVEEVEEIELSSELGDASIGLTVQATRFSGAEFETSDVFVQVGSVAAWVSLAAGTDESAPPIEAVEVLASAQAECLEDGDCPDTIELADVLNGDTGDDETTDEGDDDDPSAGDEDESSDASAEEEGEDTERGSDDTAFESNDYGYTITWDSETWEVIDESSRGGEDTLELDLTESDDTTARFTGTDAYDDAEECLEGAVDDLLADSEFEEFEQAAGGEEGDEPYEGEGTLGPYTGYTDGETGVHLECTELPSGDGVLLSVLITPLADFPDTFPLFLEVLEDIEL